MRRRGDVMWRNFGWTAILAMWTIFLILNSGLTGERILNNHPQNNNEDSPYKVHHEETYHVFDKNVDDDSRLRYARENFKSNDRSPMYVKAISLEFKNTENRDSRLSGYEKHIAMSNAMTKYLKDDKSARLITKRAATENVWLSKVIVMKKSKNIRNNLKFISSLRPSPSTFRESESTSRRRRRKKRIINVFLNDHKKVETIRHDTQALDKKDGQWKKHETDQIFSEENGMTEFFPDKFTKSPRSEKDSIQKFKNFDISQLETTKDIDSRYTNEKHKHNRDERDSCQSLEQTKNNTNKVIYIKANGESQRVEPTFSNYLRSKENRSRGSATVITTTNNAITENSLYDRSVPVTRTTLIFSSKISNANGEVGDEENTVSPYYSSEDEYSKSYEADKFLATKTYKRTEYSKIGFKVSTDAHGNKKKNGNIDLFTFHVLNSLHNLFTRKRISFTRRPFLYNKRNLLKASDISDSQSQYHSSKSNNNLRLNRKVVNLSKMHIRKKTEGEKITVAANYATHNVHKLDRDLLSTNLYTKKNDKSNLGYQIPGRISVTQKRNPIHVRHVESDANCERPQTTEFEAEVRDAFRISLWNVSDPPRIAKFSSLPEEAHERPTYARKFHAINIGAQPPHIAKTTDGRSELDEEPRRTSTESVSIFFDAANVSDNSTGMQKINGHVQSSSELTDESGLENVRVTTRRGKNHRDKHEESGFYSRSGDVHNSKNRRYKRHEDRNTPEISTSIEFDSETWKTSDTTRGTATSNSLNEFITDPSISTTQITNGDQTSTDAKKVFTSVETLPYTSKYKEFQKEWQSISLTTDHDDRYTNTPATMGSDASDSLKISLIDTPKTLNVSLVDTQFQIKALDRSSVITKIGNSVIPKEIPSSTESNVSVAANKNLFDVSSTELINSQDEHGNESVWTIDPLRQRNSDPSQGVSENITTENIVDSSAGDVHSDQWPVKHSAVVEGDLVLGGLMMVHEREDTITCGRVMPQGGVQALEAMLYTLDTLNDREIVPGVKIGAHILDDCDKDTYGLEMAVDFIKGSISNIDGAEYHCNKTAVRKVISGVVGAASSVTSIQVANLLRLFKIPQVSFFSTSPELSNKQRFEYFSRTIPSDHYQVKAMVDIVLTMGWSYVSIIYEESNYGVKAFEELEELLGKYNICIAVKEKLVKDSGVAEEVAYDEIVSKLLTKPRARGCIIFGSDQEVAGVMRAVRRRKATGVFSWIGSDGWSARGLVSNGNEPEVEGTLSVQPQANPVKGFEEYFLNLTVENNRRNPWFVEFWEDHFKCQYPNAPRTPYNVNYTRNCTTKERLTKQNTAFEDQLQFVSDAVMAFAYAFRDMHTDLCHGKAGLCDEMKPINGTLLLQYLRHVDFEGLSGDKFKFDKDGDGPARYNIIHFKQTEQDKYKWIRVGKYLEGELRLNMSEIQFKLEHPQPPESVCSLPCEVGQAKKYVEGERCCWHCFNCTQYQIRHPEDETQCMQCERGTLPDETHSMCREVPEEFLRPESGWAIGAMSFSATGMLVTLFVCGVFLKHNDTPVVRASGRELSYVLLSGILLCYFVTFTLIFKPTHIVCGIQRFAAGFCFTVVYAALLTKTNRISRIFNAGSAKRPSFISPRSQLIICSGLISVQILINIVWMIIDPARAMHHYPTMEDNLLVCNNYIDTSYMIAFTYPIILIIVCTIYAILTRKIPEAFNESKHIGLTMYTTCVIWLAFVPLYYGTGSNVALRITSMSVTISLSASVTVVCLFSPKLYIILIRPERNVRPTVRAGRPNPTKSSAITATNASSMIGPVTATTVLTAATCDQNKAIKKHIASTMDCSTQSECYEMETKERKNGDSLPTCISRSTQTTVNEKELVTVVTSNKKSPDVIVSASNMESINNTTTTKRINNNARIGNGPLSQSDVSL